MRTPSARLLAIAGSAPSMLGSRSHSAQSAAWWSACGTSHLLPGFASRLAGLPPTATDQTVTRGLRLALAAERYSPWRLWIESARTKRGQAQVDPTADRKSTRLNSSHVAISYAVFCLKKKNADRGVECK